MNDVRGPQPSGATTSTVPWLLREAALCAVVLTFLAGYFGPHLGLFAHAGTPGEQGGEASSGVLASAYLMQLFGAILTLAVRLLPGRGPAAAEAAADGGERQL